MVYKFGIQGTSVMFLNAYTIKGPNLKKRLKDNIRIRSKHGVIWSNNGIKRCKSSNISITNIVRTKKLEKHIINEL